MHRLASSEFAKHQAKCNACKMFPIVGLRYRCLRCFNFDICQNCFFSHRTAKNHKLTHPMQEYCLPTNPKNDMTDFMQMVKNKVRGNRQKLGYLAVEQVEEGQPLEQIEETPQNPSTEVIHQRMHLFAQRLNKRLNEASLAKNGTTAGELLAANKQEEISNNEGKSASLGTIHFLEQQENNSILNEENLPEKLIKNVNFLSKKPDLCNNNGRTPDVKSPSQLMSRVEQMHKEELDQLLQKLQFENMELKQAMEQKRRAAMSFLPNQSAPNLHNQNDDDETTENSLKDQKQQNITNFLRNPQQQQAFIEQQQYFLPQTHTKFIQQQQFPYGIYASANEINGGMNSGGNLKAMSMSPQLTIRQLNPANMLSTKVAPTAMDPIGRRPPPIWQQQPPAIPRHHGVEQQKNSGVKQQQQTTTNFDDLADQQVLIEARNLRLHQQRLEQRSRVLEEQNRQLQMQLERLNCLVDKRESSVNNERSGSESGYLNQICLNKYNNNNSNWTTIPRNSAFNALNKHLNYPQIQINPSSTVAGISSAEETDGYDSGAGGMTAFPMPVGGVNGLQATELRKNRMNSLMSTVNEMSRAMESFVVSMVANDPIIDDEINNNNEDIESITNEDQNRVIKT